ncbi:MAG: C39 family peptidase [Lachnospiraceae bacterium]|nr:C39 family peptidase [Lachnospiraceae bacterium]
MKNPLRYQLTEYDCGPTAVTNAISFLYEREEIPPDFVKAIPRYLLDDYNPINQKAYHAGTSTAVMRYFATWFNNYAKATDFPLVVEHLDGEDVFIGEGSKIYDALKNGNAAVARSFLGGDHHYVTLTGVDEQYVYIFDPYNYGDRTEWADGITPINDEPYRYNRKVRWEILNAKEEGDYQLGSLRYHDVLVFRKEKQKSKIKEDELV